MSKKTSPVYVITGALSAGKTTFITQCLGRRREKRNILLIQFEMGLEPLDGSSLYVPIRDVQAQSDEEIAAHMAKAMEEASADEIWIEWNGMLPVNRLLSILKAAPLNGLCRLNKIIQVADGQDYIELLARPDSMQVEQVTQCDLAVIRNADKKQLRHIRRSLKQIQGSLYMLDWGEADQIDGLIYYPNVREAIRILSVSAAGVALFSMLSFLSISIPASVTVFLGTWLQAIPFLLLGILLSSALQVFVSTDLVRRVFPKNLLGGMFFGVFAGFLMPVCDCASIPVFRSLVKKGVPLPAAVTFMTAAPVINPVVMLSTYYAFGGNGKIVLARIVLGIISSLLIGFFFVRGKGSIFTSQVSQTACTCCMMYGTDIRPASKMRQLAAHFRSELFEVGKYLLIGIAVSTVFQMALGSDLTKLSSLGLLESMLLMLLMAFLLSLCSSSDAVVGKNMGANFHIGAVMGFMVFGPMMDIKNLILMSANMSKRFIVKLAVITFGVCFAVVYAASLLGLEGWVR